MSKASLFALAGGVVSALLYLLLTTGSPGALVLAYFSQTPLLLVGLGLGLTPAAIACGVAMIGLAAATEIATAGLFLALTAMPVLYIVRQGLLTRRTASGAVEWYPPGLMLGGLTLYGLAVLAAIAMWYGGALEDVSLRYLTRLAQISGGTLGPQAQALARYIPGAVLVSGLLMAVVNAALAQGALVRMGHALRPSPAWRSVSVPRWLAPVLAIAAVTALAPDEIGTIGANAAIIAALPFMLVGLAVLHTVSQRWPARGLALGLVYVTTFILGWPAIVVAVLGIVDQWLPLRGPRTA
jgi:hypothetical protein